MPPRAGVDQVVSTVKEKLKSSADSIPADGLSMSRLPVDSDREVPVAVSHRR